ncbi:ABC transporter substrate-binding protein [Serratia entomophila]|uniref:ABC transporter substrate-binding protein n=1 Tax=Serratia entomophila TaxID=42906 RepID=UPI00217AFF17|nr:ABC transporter substrate-binding protein [Serratia entomophila]CAI0780388.1 Lysine-arginine-ornithine-binding periplasmic protein precursor [Serratia entomophila]CAI1499662.1 Lysine-arginine-ornithine-binding periplasmic protein precursor [Serratia entomophila]CAI1507153.1 Lysine-arginine-ornithine-binding periplasmic protein precursor [Serratia entomophila]CAI1511290.1 Lysine-arginine-ornithine-binding periplasmic protein precursor [Serratia entomophila]CAI1606563.1 Lysine-arginine-ornith
MKKTMGLVLLLPLALSFSALGGEFSGKVIKLGIDPTFPPLEYKTAQGTLTGFGVDIAQALCDEMQAKCVWVESSWDGMIPGLQAKKFDAIASSMTITPQREKQIAFSSKVSNAPARLVARKGSNLQPTAASLKGKSVGVQQGSSQEAYANVLWRPAGVNVIAYQSQQEVNEDLANGRLDASLLASVNASEFFKTPGGKDFAFIGAELSDSKYFGIGDGIGVRKEDTALLNAFNAALKAIIANGTYKKVNDKYFDFDMYGAGQ